MYLNVLHCMIVVDVVGKRNRFQPCNFNWSYDCSRVAIICVIKIRALLILHNHIVEDDAALHYICEIMVFPSPCWSRNNCKTSLQDAKRAFYILSAGFLDLSEVFFIHSTRPQYCFHTNLTIWINTVHKVVFIFVCVSVD